MKLLRFHNDIIVFVWTAEFSLNVFCGKAQTHNLKGSLPRIHPSDASDQWKHQTLKSAILIITCIYLPVGETCLKTVLVILFLHNLMVSKIKLKQLMLCLFLQVSIQKFYSNSSRMAAIPAGGSLVATTDYYRSEYHTHHHKSYGENEDTKTLSHMRQSHQCFPIRGWSQGNPEEGMGLKLNFALF